MGDKIKIAFLFGAGAETKGNFGLPFGFEYMRRALFEEENKEYSEALGEFFCHEYYKKKYKYRKNVFNARVTVLRNLLMSKIKSEPNFIKENCSDLSVILTDENIKHLEKYEEIEKIICDAKLEYKKDKDKKKQIENDFFDVVKKEEPKYQELKTNLLKNLFQKDKTGKIKIDFQVGISGMFDQYFYTIINPEKYSAINFSKIFNYYWTCYFIIVESILNFLVKRNPDLKEYYVKYDEKENKGTLDYLKILENISEFTKEIYNISSETLKTSKENTYYNLIRSGLNEKECIAEKKATEDRLDWSNIECVGVATTNYFNFAEIVSERVIYLNGKLNLFEFPESLEVRNFCDEGSVDNLNIFFPFIFGQSFIKPIVHHEQTESFHEFKKLLDDTCNLVILGYNINEDDNHINSFIHDYAKNNKVFFVHNKDEEPDLFDKLKLDKKYSDNVVYCKVDYDKGNKQVLDTVLKMINETWKKFI